MQVIDSRRVPSPDRAGWARLALDISVDRYRQTLRYWFDIPDEFSDAAVLSPEACLALMLPIACSVGERIEIGEPVDGHLLDNLRGLQRLWHSWYRHLQIVEIEAPSLSRAPATGPSRGASAFFSGGIDSFFTILRHLDRPLGDASSPVHTLICIGGFNTSLDDLDHMRARLRPAADRLGKTLIPVAINLRYSEQAFATPYVDIPSLQSFAHGAWLAAVGHLLSRRHSELLIASSNDYGTLVPYGSHPLTDPLFGSRAVRIVHDGTSFSRFEKTELVSLSECAMERLHVCWQDQRLGNCSRCRKCVRTMATLDLLGARNRSPTFDWTGYSLETVRWIWLNHRTEVQYFTAIAEEAARRGRADLAAALLHSIRFSRRKQTLLYLAPSNPVARAARRWGAALRSAHVGKPHPARI